MHGRHRGDGVAPVSYIVLVDAPEIHALEQIERVSILSAENARFARAIVKGEGDDSLKKSLKPVIFESLSNIESNFLSIFLYFSTYEETSFGSM